MGKTQKMRAKYYNIKLGPTLLSAFADKGYLVFIATQSDGKSTQPPAEGKFLQGYPGLVHRTILIDGACGLTDTGKIWRILKDKAANTWHDLGGK